MKVARIVQRLPPANGGKEIHALELTRALAAPGVEQTVFFADGSPPPGTRSVRAAGGLASADAWGFATWALRAVVRAHRREPLDLIHAHGDFPEALAAAALSRVLAVPAVLTVHGGLSRRREHDLLRLPAFSAMQAVVAVSDGIASDLERIGVSSRVVVQPSGVRDGFFAVERTPDATKTVVALGRLAPVKGYETLAEAARLVPDVRWRVLGACEGEYAERVRELLTAAGVEVGEAVGPEAAAAALAAADVVALPSLDLAGQREGTPTAAMEAFAVGLPVVASEASGLAAWRERGAPVTLFPTGDAAAMAAAVSEALAGAAPDRQATSALVDAWPDVAAKLLSVYEQARDDWERPSTLYATAWLEVGGAEHLLLALARDARARGYRTAVAGAPGSLVDARPEGAEYIPLARGNHPRSLASNALALAGALVRLRPRVINSHHFPVGLSGRAAALLTGLAPREVLTVHIPERETSEAVIGAVGPVLFDRVLPVSEGIRTELARTTPPSHLDRVEVIRAGVPVPPAVEPQPHTAGIVARLVERKGHRHLLAAIAAMSDEALGDWTFAIWGEGPLRAELEALADRLGIAGRVTFAGAVPEASRSLGRFELIVLPSLREGLPLLLVEAMAAGRAIVATALPGVVELVGDSGAAVLVPPADEAALAGALTDVMGSPERRAELARAGRQRYEAAFTLERMCADYAAALGLERPASSPR